MRKYKSTALEAGLSKLSDDHKPERRTSEFVDNMARFRLQEPSCGDQYCQLYTSRLAILYDACRAAAVSALGDVAVRELCQLKTNETCVVIGTLYKEMPLKPNILREIADDYNVAPLPPRSRYVDQADFLFLEDNLQRIRLCGNVHPALLVTGVVVAVLGAEHEHAPGFFQVEQMVFPHTSGPCELPLRSDDSYVAIASGLDIGRSSQLELQLLLDFLSGHLGDSAELAPYSSRVVRLILAGNCLSQFTQDREVLTRAKYMAKKVKVSTVDAVKVLDEALVQLTSALCVDLMPGEFDPANAMLPQQPLHQCMFPLAARYAGRFLPCTNPYDAVIDGVSFVGTSGQNVDDLLRYSELPDSGAALRQVLSWAHLVPTCPDTLSGFPLHGRDPLVLQRRPHVLFAGNQPCFAAELFQRVLLVAVPEFHRTAQIVLVNLRDLHCSTVCFRKP